MKKMPRWRSAFALLCSAVSLLDSTVLCSEYTTRAVAGSQAVEVQSLSELHEIITGEEFSLVSFYSMEDPYCRALVPEFIKASIRIHNDSNYRTLFAQVNVDKVFTSQSDRNEAERLFQIDLRVSQNEKWCPQIRLWTTAHSDGIKRMVHYDHTHDKRQQWWLMEYVRMQETPCFQWFQSLFAFEDAKENTSKPDDQIDETKEKKKKSDDSDDDHSLYESDMSFFDEILSPPDPHVWPPLSVDKYADQYMLDHVPERSPPLLYGQLSNPLLQRDFEEICLYNRVLFDWENVIGFSMLTPELHTRSNDNDNDNGASQMDHEDDMEDDRVWIQYQSPTGMVHSITIFDESQNERSEDPPQSDRFLSDVFHSTLSKSLEKWRNPPLLVCDPSTLERIVRIAQLSRRKIVWIAVEEEIDNRRDYLTEYSSEFLDAMIDSLFDLAVSNSYRFGQYFVFSLVSFVLYPDFVRDSLGCPYLPCIVVTDPLGFTTRLNSYLINSEHRNNKEESDYSNNENSESLLLSSEKFLFDPRIPIVNEDWQSHPNHDLITFLNMIVQRPQMMRSHRRRQRKKKNENENEHSNKQNHREDLDVYRRCEDYELNPNDCYLRRSRIQDFNLSAMNSLYNGTVYHDCHGACLDAMLCSMRSDGQNNVIVLYYASKHRESMKSVPTFIDVARYFIDHKNGDRFAQGMKSSLSSSKSNNNPRSSNQGLLMFVMVDVTLGDTAQFLDSVPLMYFYPGLSNSKGMMMGRMEEDPLPTDLCIQGAIEVDSPVEFKPLSSWLRRRLLMSRNHMELPVCKDPSQIVVTECPVPKLDSLLP